MSVIKLARKRRMLAMHPKDITRQVRLTRWAQIMKARHESGATVRSWCAKNGINEKTYYYWQRKLREAACEEYAETQVSQRTLVPVGFAQVSVSESAIHQTPERADCSQRLCAEIGPVRITAGVEYPIDRLAALLRELSSC